jgi:hypothetical protein
MSTIVLRSVKGTPLTNTEVDTNFTNLNTDKLEAATSATLTNKTINLTSNTLVATSAQLLAAITDETGTGSLVFATNPTLTGVTLAGTVSGGGNQINNVIIGTTTPLAGAFTTLSATGRFEESADIRFMNEGFGIVNAANSARIMTFNNASIATSVPLAVTGALSATGNLTISGNGPNAIGGSTSVNRQFLIQGAFNASTNAYGLAISSSLTPSAGSEAALFTTEGTLNKAGSGTHADFAAALLLPPTIGAGAATLTNASTLKITGAPSAGTNNYALWVAGGNVRLDSNLGLGVTPNTWTDLVPAFQLGNAFLCAFGTNAYSAQGANAYYSTGWKYRTTAAASVYQQNGGEHSWSSAASGTAGNAITFTQAMTLDANGNLLVGGTTSPSGKANNFVNLGGSGGFWTKSGGVGYFGTLDNYAMVFATNDTERGRFTTTGLEVTGTLGVSGQITSTIGNNAKIFSSASATTGYQYFQIQNTSGILLFGLEGSSGGSLLTNGTAYATVLTSVNSQPVEIGVNQAKVAAFLSTGLAITGTGAFTGAVSVGTSSSPTKLNVYVPSSTGPVLTLGGADGIGKVTGVRIGYGEGGSYMKSAILFENTDAAYSNGLLHLCVNTVADSSNATISDAKLTINSSGNVGIGITAPGNFNGVTFSDSILDVNGVIQVRGDATNGLALVQLGGDTYRKAAIYTPVGTDTPYLAFSVANSGTTSSGTERMRITGAGNVGIGTDNPTQKFTLLNATGTYGTAYQPIMQIGNSSSGATLTATGLGAIVWSTDGLGTPVASIEGVRESPGSGAASSLYFRTGSSGGGTTRAVLSSIGNLSITTVSKSSIYAIDTTASAAGVGASVDLGGNYRSAGDAQAFVRISAEKANGTDADYGYNMGFYTTTNGGSSMANRVMTLASDGNVGIGTTTTTGGRITASQTASQNVGYFINTNATTSYGIQIAYSGQVPNNTGNEFIYCGDTSPRFVARSNGGLANYSANDVNLSDRREKTNFAPAGSYLEKICAIPVQTFNYIDQNLEEDGGLTLGVVAQDVQAVAPELVMESNWANREDEPKMRLSIYQTDLQYALMKCIQEQQAIIESLKARLDAANL